MAVFLGVGVVSDPFGQTLDRCTHDHHKTRNHARFASLNNGQAEDQHIIATCSVDSGLNTGKSAKVRSPAKLGLDRVLLPSSEHVANLAPWSPRGGRQPENGRTDTFLWIDAYLVCTRKLPAGSLALPICTRYGRDIVKLLRFS